MTRCILFDLDNTLADLGHRLHYIKNGNRDYDSFFATVGDDKPIREVIRVCNALQQAGEIVLIVSGRSDVCREETEKWLKDHCVSYRDLIMRKHGDHRPDYTVKEEMLRTLQHEGWEPWLAVDDRQTIADVWKKNGIKTFVCDDWELTERSKAKGEPDLYIMVGPSGSGKTTWIENNLPNTYRISSDDMRFYLTGDHKDQTRNDDVFAACHGVMNQLLLNGVDVVFDATNIRNKDRKAVVKATPAGVNIHYVVIDRPMADKMLTGGWRLEVPNLIQRHHNTMQSNIKSILAGDGLNVTVLDRRE